MLAPLVKLYKSIKEHQTQRVRQLHVFPRTFLIPLKIIFSQTSFCSLDGLFMICRRSSDFNSRSRWIIVSDDVVARSQFFIWRTEKGMLISALEEIQTTKSGGMKDNKKNMMNNLSSRSLTFIIITMSKLLLESPPRLRFFSFRPLFMLMSFH